MEGKRKHSLTKIVKCAEGWVQGRTLYLLNGQTSCEAVTTDHYHYAIGDVF